MKLPISDTIFWKNAIFFRNFLISKYKKKNFEFLFRKKISKFKNGQKISYYKSKYSSIIFSSKIKGDPGKILRLGFARNIALIKAS
jgi:hypothetical protein